MSALEFEVDVDRMKKDIDKCGVCNECYVEQIWRDRGEDKNAHCDKTKKAFKEALAKWNDIVHKDGTDLPQKDEITCITLKNGKRICAQLFYDEEEKPCMWYDDFDNWYSMNDVKSWIYIGECTRGKIKITVDK